jgi:hypothetical protein
MNETSTIYQCEECLRFFALGEGGFTLLQPLPVRAGLPEGCACGWADCREIALARREETRRIDEAGQRAVAVSRVRAHRTRVAAREGAGRGGRVARGNCRDGKASRTVKALGGAAAALAGGGAGAEAFRGCPPERETVVVGTSQREFLEAVDVSGAHRVLLEYFRERYGEWIPMVTLMELPGCLMVHSRVAELRGLLPKEEDIDQETRYYEATGRGHSHYRLCLKAESVRLKRREAAAEGQQELDTERRAAR